MASPRRHSVLNQANVTASGNSGTLPNIGQNIHPSVLVQIDVKTAPTGSSPSITFTLNAVGADGALYPLVTGAALTTVGAQRLVAIDVLDQNLQLNWVVTGGSADFPNVSADIYLTAPSS